MDLGTKTSKVDCGFCTFTTGWNTKENVEAAWKNHTCKKLMAYRKRSAKKGV